MELRDVMPWRWLVGFVAFVLSGFGVWPAPHVAPGGVPDAFAERPSLPDCGLATQFVGQVDPSGAAVDCFDAALAAGGTAELVVEAHGNDAGPIVKYFRALPGGGVEVFMDHRQDVYRSVDWQAFFCPQAQSSRDQDLGECTDREL